MKTLGAILFLFLICLPLSAQSRKTAQGFAVKATVDERVELTSIVARLAEYDEYVNHYFKSYASDVDQYFAKYKSILL